MLSGSITKTFFVDNKQISKQTCKDFVIKTLSLSQLWIIKKCQWKVKSFFAVLNCYLWHVHINVKFGSWLELQHLPSYKILLNESWFKVEKVTA